MPYTLRAQALRAREVCPLLQPGDLDSHEPSPRQQLPPAWLGFAQASASHIQGSCAGWFFLAESNRNTLKGA